MECRICLENAEKNPLVAPCLCIEKVHEDCLKTWILRENNDNPMVCEICMIEYNLEYKRLFSEFNFIQLENEEEENIQPDNQLIVLSIDNNQEELFSNNPIPSSGRTWCLLICTTSMSLFITNGVIMLISETECINNIQCQTELKQAMIIISITIIVIFFLFGFTIRAPNAVDS